MNIFSPASDKASKVGTVQMRESSISVTQITNFQVQSNEDLLLF